MESDWLLTSVCLTSAVVVHKSTRLAVTVLSVNEHQAKQHCATVSSRIGKICCGKLLSLITGRFWYDTTENVWKSIIAVPN